MSNKSPEKKNGNPVQHQVDCYVRWLKLKKSKEYREASLEIRQLQDRLREAEEHLRAAHDAYQPFLEADVPDSKKKRDIRKKYWTAEGAATKALKALSAKEAGTCKKFGLDQWWAPEDVSVGLQDAQHIVIPFFPVVVLDPTPDKRADLNAEGTSLNNS